MGARTLRMTAALAASLAALTLSLSAADAAVSGVTASPARTSVPAAGPASVTVNWQVERSVTDLPNPGTVSSAGSWESWVVSEVLVHDAASASATATTTARARRISPCAGSTAP